MSDFLASLIDRAVNRAPILERRRPSLFEPPGPGQGRLGAPLPDLSLETREPGAASELETHIENEAAAPRTPSLPKHRPVHPLRLSEDESGTIESESANRNVGSVGSPSKRRTPLHKREHAEEIVEAGPPRRNQVPAAQINETIRAARQNETPRAAHIPPPSRKNGEAPEHASPDSAPSSPRHMLKPVHSSITSAPAHPPPSPTPNPRGLEKPLAVSLRTAPTHAREPIALARRARSAPGPDAVRTPPALPGPPPIHVTIGRLEVRAIRAAETPPRARKLAAPRLSLEDYLLNRNGGVR